MSNVLISGEIGRLDDVSSIDGSNDKIPVLKSDGTLEKASANQIASGADAVDGPASATDNAVCVFDGATGKLIKDSTLSITEAQTRELTVIIDDISTAGSVFIASPYAGTITSIQSVIDGAITVADAVITSEIGGVTVTDSAITIANAGSGAGVVDSATPSAANVLAVGDALEAITDGGSTGTVKGTITYTIVLS